MPRDYSLKLDKYDISTQRYKELAAFCKQYDEKRLKLQSIHSLQAIQLSDKIQSNTLSDITAKKAIEAVRLRNDIELIETTTKEASKDLHRYILMNVTLEIPYNYLRYTINMPCGRNEFYEVRRKFFYLLDKNKK